MGERLTKSVRQSKLKKPRHGNKTNATADVFKTMQMFVFYHLCYFGCCMHVNIYTVIFAFSRSVKTL